MITVKHVLDRGNEAIYSGTHASWHEQAVSGDPQETALVLFDRDAVVQTFNQRGVVYVMNAAGKTVAHYVLPPGEDGDGPLEDGGVDVTRITGAATDNAGDPLGR